MATATKTKGKTTKKGITAADAFRQVIARKKQPAPTEAFIAEVRKLSGSKSFDASQLAWYKSRHKSGELSEGRASNN